MYIFVKKYWHFLESSGSFRHLPADASRSSVMFTNKICRKMPTSSDRCQRLNLNLKYKVSHAARLLNEKTYVYQTDSFRFCATKEEKKIENKMKLVCLFYVAFIVSYLL